jgi:hypothetical protein
MGFMTPKKTTTSNSTQTATTTPTYSGAFSGMPELLTSNATNMLNKSTDMSGYTASGMANINNIYNASNVASNNDLTRRGLSTSPVAAAVGGNNANARAGASASFQNSVPLLQHDMQIQDLISALNVMNSGKGTSGTGTSSGTSTETGTWWDGLMKTIGTLSGAMV